MSSAKKRKTPKSKSASVKHTGLYEEYYLLRDIQDEQELLEVKAATLAAVQDFLKKVPRPNVERTVADVISTQPRLDCLATELISSLSRDAAAFSSKCPDFVGILERAANIYKPEVVAAILDRFPCDEAGAAILDPLLDLLFSGAPTSKEARVAFVNYLLNQEAASKLQY